MLEEAQARSNRKKQYEDGIITEGERHSKIISIWTEVSDKLSEELFKLIYDTSTADTSIRSISWSIPVLVVTNPR